MRVPRFVVITAVYCVLLRAVRHGYERTEFIAENRRKAGGHITANMIMTLPLLVTRTREKTLSYGTWFLIVDMVSAVFCYPSPIREMRCIHHCVTMLAFFVSKYIHPTSITTSAHRAHEYWSNVVYRSFRLIELTNVINSVDYLLRNVGDTPRTYLVGPRLLCGLASRTISLSMILYGFYLHRLCGMRLPMVGLICGFVLFFSADINAGIHNQMLSRAASRKAARIRDNQTALRLAEREAFVH